ncbi:MAG: proline dehydrogenase family protein [Thermoproteota archaeon]|jgi:proline dehydrogenase|nr:proline dehydrogenase family protein [Thermoproteota archaeon]
MKITNLFAPLVKRWIGGSSIIDAINATRYANEKGMGVILNYLGEDIKDLDKVKRNLKEYILLLKFIKKYNLDSSISVKLTQIGLYINEKICEDNLSILLKEAKKYNIKVWLDMESSKYTSKTIEIYLKGLDIYRNLGIAIQAYLKRSLNDVNKILKHEGEIRLVKGAYNEPESIAYKKKSEINKNFLKLMEILYKNSNKFTIATHDEKLIYESIKLNKIYAKNPTYAFLRGVRNDIKRYLLNYKFRVEEYIPYGEEWIGYIYRRMRERKSNILLVLTSLFAK